MLQGKRLGAVQVPWPERHLGRECPGMEGKCKEAADPSSPRFLPIAGTGRGGPSAQGSGVTALAAQL